MKEIMQIKNKKVLNDVQPFKVSTRPMYLLSITEEGTTEKQNTTTAL